MFVDWLAILSAFSWQNTVNFFVNLGITGALFWAALQFVAKKTIDYKVTQKIQEHQAKLNMELEAYKTELQQEMKAHEQKLQVLTEEAKYRFNCMSQDYNMYSKQRYESYVDIRKKLVNVLSYTLGLRGLVQIPDFAKFSKQEVEEWLDERKFGQLHKDSVLQVWDKYPKDAVKRLEELQGIYNEYTANKAYGDMHNAIVDSELFLSDELSQMLNNCKFKIHDLLTKYKLAKSVGPDQIVKWVEEEQKLEKELPEIMKQITAQMKAELTYANKLKDKAEE